MNTTFAKLLGLRVTLVLVGIVAGVYLYLACGNDNAWEAMTVLLRKSVAIKAAGGLLVFQVFMCGVARIARGRLRALPAGMILVSLSILILSALLSLQERQSSRIRVNASEQAGPGLRVLEVHANFPSRVLSIGESQESVHGPASAILNDRGGTVMIRSFPPAMTSRGLAYVDDAGISSHYRFLRGSEVVDADKLALLPPGRKAAVPLGGGYEAEIALAPIREFAKGRLEAREYSLVEPSYRISLKRGGEAIGSAVARDGDQVRLAGVSVQVSHSERWVEVVFVRDSYAAVAWAAVIGLLVGIVTFPVWAGVGLALRARRTRGV